MKIIDVLNDIAKGEIDEDYEIGYNNECCTIKEFLNRYIVDEENLNLNVELFGKGIDCNYIPLIPDDELIILKQEKAIDMQKAIDFNFKVLQEKINQVVEELNKRQ